MAVVSVTETWDRDGERDQRGMRRYTRTLRVRTSSFMDGPAVVLVANTLPRVRDPYVDQSGLVDALARCKAVKARQDGDNPLLWEVTCSYDTEQEKPGEEDDDPLLKPADISFGSSHSDKNADVDANGEAVKNSAGDPFKEGVKYREDLLTMDVTRNQLAFSPVLIQVYVGATNADVFLGCEPDTVLCEGLSAERKYEKGYLYWAVKYKFVVNPRRWVTKVLDAGFEDVLGAPAVDTSGAKKSTPKLLDGDGLFLEAGDDPVFLEFQMRPKVPFAPLGIEFVF